MPGTGPGPRRGLKTWIGHNVGLHTTSSVPAAWPPSRAGARRVRGGAGLGNTRDTVQNNVEALVPGCSLGLIVYVDPPKTRGPNAAHACCWNDDQRGRGIAFVAVQYTAIMMALFATTARGPIGPFHRHTFAQSGASPLSGTAKCDASTEHRFEAGGSEQAVGKHAQQYCAKNQRYQ